MKATIYFPIEEIKRTLSLTQKRIEASKKELLDLIGVRLVSFAKQDYRTKSRGGIGTDGIQWAANSPSTIARKNARAPKGNKKKLTKSGKIRPGVNSVGIGIDSGLQQSSVSPTYDKNGVTVEYHRTYAEYFDEKRKLLPEELPDTWRDSLEQIAVRHVERKIREGFGQND